MTISGEYTGNSISKWVSKNYSQLCNSTGTILHSYYNSNFMICSIVTKGFGLPLLIFRVNLTLWTEKKSNKLNKIANKINIS